MRPKPRWTLRAALAGIALVVAASAIPAAAQGDVLDQEYRVTAHDDAEAPEPEYWFELESSTERNPQIPMMSNSTVVVHFANEGSIAHNLRFGEPLNVSTERLDPGGEETLTLEVPGDAFGLFEYYDDVFRPLGMQGVYRIEREDVPANDTEDEAANGTPGPGVVAAAAALAGAAGARSMHRRGRS